MKYLYADYLGLLSERLIRFDMWGRPGLRIIRSIALRSVVSEDNDGAIEESSSLGVTRILLGNATKNRLSHFFS